MVPPAQRSNEQPQAQVLRHAQIAPQYLELHSTSASHPLPSLIKQAESVELWNTYEQLLVSCLTSGDDKTAHMCLERLTGRFGPSNERVMGLKGVYLEAIAETDRDLEKTLRDYENTLSQNPVNGSIAKRRIALLKSLGKHEEAIKALTELLDYAPVDAEAWAELSELYFMKSLYPQAVYCLEEVLLIFPNAWNVHARVGEILYISSSLSATDADQSSDGSLVDALHRFCRSIELCDGYLRGWCGVKMACQRLMGKASKEGKTLDKTSALSSKTVLDLDRRADEALSRISKEEAGSNRSDVLAAREIMSQVESR